MIDCEAHVARREREIAVRKNIVPHHEANEMQRDEWIMAAFVSGAFVLQPS